MVVGRAGGGGEDLVVMVAGGEEEGTGRVGVAAGEVVVMEEADEVVVCSV